MTSPRRKVEHICKRESSTCSFLVTGMRDERQDGQHADLWHRSNASEESNTNEVRRVSGELDSIFKWLNSKERH